MAGGVNRLVLLCALLGALAACESPTSPPTGPESVCASACRSRVSVCRPQGCWRGCNLILDRLAENEGENVIACVAQTAKVCDNRAWSHCAARIGIHADGGPPAPPPPKDTEDEDDQESQDQL